MLAESKSSHLQIRVTRREKAELVRRAKAAGLDLSAFVLRMLAPDASARFVELAGSLGRKPMDPFVLAEIHDFLQSLDAVEFRQALQSSPGVGLDALSSNQLAAMIETRAARLGVRPAEWVERIPPLRQPWFVTELVSLRARLLCHSPAAFRRRNLFVDATLGDRV